MELAQGCSITLVESWLKARQPTELVDFLGRRHAERFFDPIDCLKVAARSHEGYGFSMMSLCCLLVETIQCYRVGLPTTSGIEWKDLKDIERSEAVPPEYLLPKIHMSGRDAFRCFFVHYQTFFPQVDGDSFYDNIRNGLLHQAQTKGGWTINNKGSMVCDPASTNIHRDLFAKQLRACFESYLEDLSASGWKDEIWKKAARKIWWLIRLSKP